MRWSLALAAVGCSGGGAPADASSSVDAAARTNCAGAGGQRIAARDCCRNLYCTCINGDTCDQPATCTATPACGKLGDTCLSNLDCCEPDATACAMINGSPRCCISAALQAQHAGPQWCYSSSDCCPGGVCDTATGVCH